MQGHKFVETCDFVASYLVWDLRQPNLRISFIELGGFDKCVDNSHGYCPHLENPQRLSFRANGHLLDDAFGGVVVQFQEAILKIWMRL